MREVVLIDADSHHAELYRRGNKQWRIELVRGLGGALFLASIEQGIAMSELYEGIAMAADDALDPLPPLAGGRG